MSDFTAVPGADAAPVSTSNASGAVAPQEAGGSTPPVTPVAASGSAKVAVSFLVRDSDAQLIVSSGRIVQSMTGNHDFTTPVPALATVVATRNAYVAAVNAVDRSRLSIGRRMQARAELVMLLRALALNVQQASNGDPVKLLTTGYPLQRTRQPVGVLHAPTNLRLKPARISGQMLARCNVVTGARSYQWRCASATAPTAWTLSDPTTTASYTLVGLVAGTLYVVQVRASGSSGPSDWSDQAVQMAS